MKNLQKTLSLVLAMVMIFGMFAVTANAAEVADLDTVGTKYVEAVQVVNGMGIIEGDENGVFNPKGEITRAGMAKLICYIVLGKEGAEGLSKNASKFTDVPAGEWYAGYVNYCANAGYINGNGDGTFSPDAGISGYGVGKLLLSALGYGKNGEYLGEGWEMKVAQDALNAKIFAGNVGGLNENVATREEVALYIYNTLKAQPVSYLAALDLYTTQGMAATLAQKVGYGAIVDTDEGVITDNTAITETLNDEDLGAMTTVAGTDYVFESALEDLGTYVKVVYGDIEENGSYDEAKDKVYAVITLSTKVEVAKAIDKADAYKKAFGSEETKATAATKSFDGAYAPSADFVADGKNASVGTYHIYKKEIKGYVAPLAESLEEVKEFKTDKGVTKISTTDGSLKTAVETKYVAGADAVAKNDVVLVAQTGDYYTVKKAETVQGKGTAVTADADKALTVLTLEGKTYAASAAEDKSGLTKQDVTKIDAAALKANTYKLYLDSKGNYVAVVLVDTTVASDVVYVNDVYTLTTADAYGTTTTKAYAQIVKMDGTVENLLVDIWQDLEGDDNDKWLASESATKETGYEYYDTTGLYTYTAYVATSAIDPLTGTYEFDEAVAAYDADYPTRAYAKDLTISESKTLTEKDITLGGVYINANTKFLYVTGTKGSTKVEVKGLTANTIAAATLKAIVAKVAQGNEVAQYVIVNAAYAAYAAPSTDLIYLADTTPDAANTLGNVYVCYLNGVKSELVIDETVKTGFWTYTVKDGVYTLKTEAADVDTGAGVYYNELFTGLYGTKITSTELKNVEAADAVIVDTVNTLPDKKITSLEGMLKAKTAGTDVYFHAVVAAVDAETVKVTTIYVVADEEAAAEEALQDAKDAAKLTVKGYIEDAVKAADETDAIADYTKVTADETTTIDTYGTVAGYITAVNTHIDTLDSADAINTYVAAVKSLDVEAIATKYVAAIVAATAEVETLDELKAAIADDDVETIVLTANITVDEAIDLKGKNLDGNGKKILAAVDLASDSGLKVITTSGGKISNLTISGGWYGIDVPGAMTSDLVLENVVVVNAVRALHIEVINTEDQYELKATNCTFSGKLAYGAAASKATFTNCKFEVRGGTAKGDVIDFWADTTFTGCDFESGFKFSFADLLEQLIDAEIKLVDCTVDGEAIADATYGMIDKDFTFGE